MSNSLVQCTLYTVVVGRYLLLENISNIIYFDSAYNEIAAENCYYEYEWAVINTNNLVTTATLGQSIYILITFFYSLQIFQCTSAR